MTDALPAPDFLSSEDLLTIAEGILRPVRIRDLGLLESAANRPSSSPFGELAYCQGLSVGSMQARH